ncbi:hypothetical protein MMC30_003315 [Trapelia coarctata]|nr:hypothetical protein [Trapelia coarctata]
MVLTRKSAALIAVSVVFPVLAAAAVGLRLQARRTRSLSLKGDDYWIILALVITGAGSIPYIIGSCIGGIGEHVQGILLTVIDIPSLELKILFVTQFFYIFSVAPVKISILLFYKRIFITRGFSIAANSVLTFVMLWSIAFFFVTLFQAWPISYNWTGIGTPIQYDIMYDVCAATDILSDLLTLCLPIPMIRSLQLSTRRKWILSSVFGLGGFCVVSSAIRLYYLTVISNPAEATDLTYQTADILIWSAIEPCTSIICACLPTLGPLFKGGRTPESLVNSLRSYFSNRSRSSVGGSKDRKNSDDTNSASDKNLSAEKRSWMAKDSTVNSTAVAAVRTDLKAQRELSPLPQGINVKTKTTFAN